MTYVVVALAGGLLGCIIQNIRLKLKKKKIYGQFIIFTNTGDEDGTACGVKIIEPIEEDADVITLEVVRR